MIAEEKVLKPQLLFANYIGTTQWGDSDGDALQAAWAEEKDKTSAGVWSYDFEKSSLIQFPATGEPQMNIYTFAVYRPFVLSDAKKVELNLDDETTLDIKLDSTIQIYNGIKI